MTRTTITAAVILIALIAGLLWIRASTSPPPPTTTKTTVSPTTPAPTRPTPTPSSPAPSPAQLALDALPVRTADPMTGYTRDAFGPAWSDDVTTGAGHNGCDQANDIRRRDLTAVTLKPNTHGCVVLTGTGSDPFTGATRRGPGTAPAPSCEPLWEPPKPVPCSTTARPTPTTTTSTPTSPPTAPTLSHRSYSTTRPSQDHAAGSH